MTREEVKIGFIGFGNMGQAIADGFLYTHTLKPSQMCACAVNYEKLKKNTEKRGMKACRDSKGGAGCGTLFYIEALDGRSCAGSPEGSPCREDPLVCGSRSDV